MKNRIRCEACGKATPGYDIVNYTSVDEASRQLCNQCYNAEVASMLDLKGFGDFHLDPISITDCVGEKHEFHLRMFLRGEQVAVEAFELEDETPAGHQFQIFGDVDDDVLVLVGRLVERIRRRLSVRYLVQDESGLGIANQTVCGRIQWDEEADDGQSWRRVGSSRYAQWATRSTIKPIPNRPFLGNCAVSRKKRSDEPSLCGNRLHRWPLRYALHSYMAPSQSGPTRQPVTSI